MRKGKLKFSNLFIVLILSILFISETKAQDHLKLLSDGERDFEKIRTGFYDYWNRTGQKNSDLKKFHRWEYMMMPRLDHGQLPTSKSILSRVGEYDEQKSKSSSARTQTSNLWETMGPYNWEVEANGYSPGNGRINCITVDPSNDQIIFIGSAGGGIWKSVDGGDTWSTNTDQLGVLGFTDIYIDPSNTQVVWGLTGDGYGNDTPSIGLVKSTDGGETWNLSSLVFDEDQYVTFMKLEVSNGVMLVAGRGIYRSEDEGETWNKVMQGYMADLIFHPTDPSIVYATERYPSGSNQLTVYKSIDAGVTWAPIGFDFPELGKSLSRTALAIAPTAPDMLYVIASSDDATFGGLFRSDDQLETLTLQSSTPNILGYDENGQDDEGQGWYDLAISVDPERDSTIFIGGVHVWKSSDAGTTWEVQNNWVWDHASYPYVHADIHTIDFYGTDMYIGCDGGIFKTENLGETFSNLSFGLNIGQFYRLGVHPSDENVVIGGLQDNGSFLKKNDQWYQIYGADGMEALIDYEDPTVMYSSYQYGGIIRFSHEGSTIQNFLSNPDEESGRWITPYMLHPTNHSTIYVGYENVWKSEDQGDKMTRISDFQVGGTIEHLKQNEENANELLVYVGGILYLTTDEGGSWQDITTGLPGYGLSDMTFSNEGEHIIYATFSGYRSSNQVLKSTDNGATWVDVSEGLPSVPVNCIAINNECAKEVYIGTDIGVFIKKGNASWSLLGDGMPNVGVEELEFQYANDLLFAATYGRGIWKIEMDKSNGSEQLLTFDRVEAKVYGAEDFELSAMVDSDLEVKFSSSDVSVVEIEGSIAHIIGAGMVELTASQDGNCDFQSVESIQSIEIAKAEQGITFEPLEEQYIGEEYFTLIAESTSGLDVTFESGDESKVEIIGNRARMLNHGEVTISAVQAGNDNYIAAESVEQIKRVLVLGLQDFPEGFALYPNPSSLGYLQLDFPASGEQRSITILDMNGKQVFNVNVGGNENHRIIKTASFETGLYYIQFQEHRFKVVIQ